MTSGVHLADPRVELAWAGADELGESNEVVLPVARTTSCCLGGEGLDTLSVTSARRGLRPGGAPPERHGGAVFAVPVAVPGVAPSRWHDDSARVS